MARSRDPHREHYWRQHLLRQHSSGLSISAYCTRECISVAAFYAWKKRLTPSLPALPEPSVFVPVNIASVPTRQIDTVLYPAIEIELARHVQLRVASLPEPEWLCRVAAGLSNLLGKEVGA
jgi:hypothetical protein